MKGERSAMNTIEACVQPSSTHPTVPSATLQSAIQPGAVKQQILVRMATSVVVAPVSVLLHAALARILATANSRCHRAWRGFGSLWRGVEAIAA